tara:strand:+ start:169 stop:1299 length:1131 start_codon:yes stop_codon:yes gene_type:complete
MGKTTCSWCYNKGHRITTCEEYFEYLDKTVKYYGNDKMLTPKERKHYKGFIAKKENKPTGSTRRCSFCGSYGHNIRSCDKVQALKKDYEALNKCFRMILEKGLKGYGPGALVTGARRNRRNSKKVEWSWTGMVNHLDLGALSLGHFVSSGHVQDFSQSMTAVKLSDKWHVKRESVYYNPLADKPAGHIERVSVPFTSIYNASFSDDSFVQEVQVSSMGKRRLIDSRKEATSNAWLSLCHWGGGVVSAVTGSIDQLHTHACTTVDLVSYGSDVSLSDRDMSEGWTQFLDRAKKLFKQNKKNQDMICYATKLLTIMASIVPRELHEHVPERYKKTRSLIRQRTELQWSDELGYLANYNYSGYLDVVYAYELGHLSSQR